MFYNLFYFLKKNKTTDRNTSKGIVDRSIWKGKKGILTLNTSSTTSQAGIRKRELTIYGPKALASLRFSTPKPFPSAAI
jgi:hypothetical protein